MRHWKRGEFLFCFIIIWTAALFQGYGLYQEWRAEKETVEAFKLLEVSPMEGIVKVTGADHNFVYQTTDDTESLLQYKTKAERFMKRNKVDYKTSLTLKGSRPGKMSLNEKAEVTDRLFHSLKAEEVEAVKEVELYTVYGFSPLFENSISYGENEINLNLAFSYDEVEARTLFYLSIPFVEEDF